MLERDCYICRECGREAGESAHVDHVEPHRGRWSLFIDERNLQVLCASCHGKKSASEGA